MNYTYYCTGPDGYDECGEFDSDSLTPECPKCQKTNGFVVTRRPKEDQERVKRVK